MHSPIRWPRFLLTSAVTALIVLVLYGAVQTLAPPVLHEGYPGRAAGVVKSLYGFLAVVSIAQLMGFLLLYLWIYPQRTLKTALWWGVWGGFFMVLPDTHFFVDTPNMSWALLIWQMVTGMAAGTLATVIFRLLYRPQNENWTPAPIASARFFVTGGVVAIVVFVVDLAFHAVIAPKYLAPYPAADFPERTADEMQSLLAWLLLTYVVHGLYMFYTYLRAAYPQEAPARGTTSAAKYGLWLGVWILIPNMQFFVGLAGYTAHMLAVQVVEGVLLIMLSIVLFERMYRPAPAGVAASAAA